MRAPLPRSRSGESGLKSVLVGEIAVKHHHPNAVIVLKKEVLDLVFGEIRRYFGEVSEPDRSSRPVPWLRGCAGSSGGWLHFGRG